MRARLGTPLSPGARRRRPGFGTSQAPPAGTCSRSASVRAASIHAGPACRGDRADDAAWPTRPAAWWPPLSCPNARHRRGTVPPWPGDPPSPPPRLRTPSSGSGHFRERAHSDGAGPSRQGGLQDLQQSMTGLVEGVAQINLRPTRSCSASLIPAPWSSCSSGSRAIAGHTHARQRHLHSRRPPYRRPDTRPDRGADRATSAGRPGTERDRHSPLYAEAAAFCVTTPRFETVSSSLA